MILHRKEGIAGRQSASQTVLAVVVLMGLAVVQALQPVPEIFKQCVNYKTDSHRTTYGDFVSGTPTRWVCVWVLPRPMALEQAKRSVQNSLSA